MATRAKTDYLICDFKDQPPGILRTRCGKREVIKLPMPIRAFVKFEKYLRALHKDCKAPPESTP